MSWKTSDLMSVRREFSKLAMCEGANISALCVRFGISRKTGYKWLARYRQAGEAGLVEQSRRPKVLRCPTTADMEQRVLELRDQHPAWGGRKLRARLLAAGHDQVPAASTISGILKRHGRISPEASRAHQPFQRFERPAPNDLWQIDFKGEFAMDNGRYCYPLTVLDDHSRYVVGLAACADQTRESVMARLIDVFRRYGLPRAMYADNGPPWGSMNSPTRQTRFTTWLMRMDIEVIHGTPFHPQGRGKEERFHRTLKAELLQDRRFAHLAAAQSQFDPYRDVYNHERPHEALGLRPPAERYRPSLRSYPEALPVFEYSSRFTVRRTNPVGQFRFQGQQLKIGEAFASQPIGLTPTLVDGVWDVYFCHFPVGQFDLRDPDSKVRPAGSLATTSDG